MKLPEVQPPPVKLTKSQDEFLALLEAYGPRETVVNYPPALKLVELGFAVEASRKNPINGRVHPRFYEITDAGRAYRAKA